MQNSKLIKACMDHQLFLVSERNLININMKLRTCFPLSRLLYNTPMGSFTFGILHDRHLRPPEFWEVIEWQWSFHQNIKVCVDWTLEFRKIQSYQDNIFRKFTIKKKQYLLAHFGFGYYPFYMYLFIETRKGRIQSKCVM